MTLRTARPTDAAVRAHRPLCYRQYSHLHWILLCFASGLWLTALFASPAWAENVGIPIDPSVTPTTAPATTPTTPSSVSTAPETGTPTTLAPTATSAPGASSEETTSAPGTGGAGLRQPPASDFPGLMPGLQFPQASVAFMPEYDSQDVLVIIDYQLPSDAKIPFTFRFRIPRGARMSSYALAKQNGDFDHDGLLPPKTIAGSTGEWDTVEFQVPRNQPIHLEYYYNPGLNTAGKRDFPIVFESPATIDRFTISVQQPARASGFTLAPPLAQQGQDGFGMTASSSSLVDLKPGEIVKMQVAYVKPDANPSVLAEGAEPSATAQTAASTNYLLWLFAALVVGVGGVVAYRTLGSRSAHASAHSRTGQPQRSVRTATPNRTSVRRATGARRPPSAQPSRQAFCTQCGKALAQDDRFCGGCGEEREDPSSS